MARRANKRQRRQARERAHDLRQRYNAADLPFQNGIAVATFDDPYGVVVDSEGNVDGRARLAQVQHTNGSLAEGAPSWTPPRRPQITAFISLKEDPFGRMFARRQVDRAQFEAGRTYQLLADTAEIGIIHSVDLSRTPVSGSRLPDPLTDRRLRAFKKLRELDEVLVQRFGIEGLAITKAILVDRKSQEQTAKDCGADNVRDKRSVGWLFRRCLDVLAQGLGFVSGTGAGLRRLRKPVRPEDEPEKDPARRATAAEIADPALRHGRPGS